MNLNPAKLLIVDESTLVVHRLYEILGETNGIDRPLYAGTFTEALELIKKQGPGIVMLDIQLSDNRGFELLKFIKQHYPGMITIVLTNKVSENYRRICKKNGADFFIDKSSEFEKIPGIVESLIPVKI